MLIKEIEISFKNLYPAELLIETKAIYDKHTEAKYNVHENS
jgi:hypothetical protein